MTTHNDQKTKGLLPERMVRIALWKAVMSVLGIVAVSSLGSVWATVSVFNTVPFRVQAIETDVLTIKEELKAGKDIYMSLALSQEKWKNNDLQHAEIIKRLDLLQASINRL